MPRLRNDLKLSLGTGAVTLTASLLSRTSYDEWLWIGNARMVASGRSLYVDALDNKSPVVHALVWVIDSLPGSFVLIRSTVVGALVAAITFQLARLVPFEGTPRGLLAAVGGLMAAALSQFHLTVELPALALLLAVPRQRRPVVVSLAITMAMAFDPRILLLIPSALLWRQRVLAPDTRWAEWLTAASVAAGVGAVLVVPRLRFGLVELNLATRVPSIPVYLFLLLMAVVALPFLGFFAGGFRWNGGRVASLWLLGAVGIPLLSLSPFDHYWVYVVGLFAAGIAPVSRIWAPAYLAIALAFFPIALKDLTLVPEQNVADHLAAADLIDSRAPGQSVLYVGKFPVLGAQLPSAIMSPSPTSLYMFWNTSRREEFVAQFLEHLSTAKVVAVDSDSPLEAPAIKAMETRLTCVVEFDTLTVYMDPSVCPSS